MKDIGQPDWATNIKRALRSLEQDEKESEQIPQPAYREYAKASHAVARKKYEAELRTYQEALDAGYVVVDTIVNLPFRESAGLRLTKFFNALKEEGKILALRCPECRRTIFPPRAVCGFCRVTAGAERRRLVCTRRPWNGHFHRLANRTRSRPGNGEDRRRAQSLRLHSPRRRR